jgi:hypothetical protein
LLFSPPLCFHLLLPPFFPSLFSITHLLGDLYSVLIFEYKYSEDTQMHIFRLIFSPELQTPEFSCFLDTSFEWLLTYQKLKIFKTELLVSSLHFMNLPILSIYFLGQHICNYSWGFHFLSPKPIKFYIFFMVLSVLLYPFCSQPQFSPSHELLYTLSTGLCVLNHGFLYSTGVFIKVYISSTILFVKYISLLNLFIQ